MATTNYVPASLFGGAITCLLPSHFADVSNLRQVPDNQEVYLDTDGFTSIAVDILERVDKPDREALEWHLKDIVEEDVGKMKVWRLSEARLAKMPEGTPAYTLFATSPPGAKQRCRSNEPAFVGMLLTLIRLVEQKTDIVVAVNVPHVEGTYDPAEVDPQSGRHGKLVQSGMEYREKILESFGVKDWGLFVQE
ncbi:hypothetical protein LTR53_004893 [Teratosphaeriaceae sp. CCFEE 6253]|nr:hypothetical protein LTR53_004893 [Teratosphaeriaceae sp. CCFEE 6253]